MFANGSSVQKITPRTLTVSNFYRGFDAEKTIFELKKDGERVNIATSAELFIIINGILQKTGTSYTLAKVDGGLPTEHTTINFSEAPADGVSFNCFYVGELIAIRERYAGYLKRQDIEIESLHKSMRLSIPKDIDYMLILSLIHI